MHVVSVSLGSSKRDHSVRVTLLEKEILVERRGTDGDFKKALQLIAELDGKVDAIGLGGIDRYIYAGGRRYTLRDGERMARAAKITPAVDGSGLKNTLERRVVQWIIDNKVLDLRDMKVLMVSAVDRFGMAESLLAAGAKLTMGDLIFIFGLPLPLKTLDGLARVARVIAPVACRLPFQWLYPTGEKQEKSLSTEKYKRYFDDAELIAGDFHFIRRYMPSRLDGKVILTNTVTAEDLALLRERGVEKVITTTPELEGRSFGTNVMEAILVALIGKPVEAVSAQDYNAMLDQLDFKPRVETF